MATKSTSNGSVFAEANVSSFIAEAKTEIQSLYCSDTTPWLIGYSGGKDSTAVLQLVWMALADLEPEALSKPVFVLTTDTLVENPIVAQWVNLSLNRVKTAAEEQALPFKPHLATPSVEDSFWVNLMGKGYPAPRHKFRWCTERLKIRPSNRFIQDVASKHGEVIMLLGTRRAESTVRSARMKKRERIGSNQLSRHDHLINTLIYTPVEHWSNDDVWTFLMRFKNPWGHRNKDLLNMYRGATEDNECPVVVDTSTPSCGSSRFGCWTCTLVDKDKSMTAMITNDAEKDWMRPLLDFRNELDYRGDQARKLERQRRDFKRLGGYLTHYKDKDGETQLVPGPYTQKARSEWLRKLLTAQNDIQNNPDTPKEARGMKLISIEELKEIRRIWLVEKHEIEDLLPQIYEEILSKPYPDSEHQDDPFMDEENIELLQQACEDDLLLYETTRNLIGLELQYKSQTRRTGIKKAIEKTISQRFFDDAEDAKQWKLRQLKLRESEAGELLQMMEQGE